MIGSVELAAQSEITSIFFLFILISDSLLETTITMLGNLLGENRVPLAKRLFTFISWLIIPGVILMALALVLFREFVAVVFSDVPEVQDMLMDVIPFFAIYLALLCIVRHF